MMRLGFIGLGSQGGPMARRIVDAGYPTTLWARRSASLEPFADTAATVAGSPAELASASDLVCICVLGDADVEEVLCDDNGVLAGIQPGGAVAIHSTVHPDTCRRLAIRAAQGGVSLIDAPVSGGGDAAAARRLLVMVGGDPATLERVRPVFATYGDPILHLGPVGAGQTAKLLNNLIFTAHLATATNLFALGRALDVEPAVLAEVLTHGSGRSFGAEMTVGMGFTVAPSGPQVGPLLQKDVTIIAQLAAAAGAPVGILLDAADETLRILEHPRAAVEPPAGSGN